MISARNIIGLTLLAILANFPSARASVFPNSIDFNVKAGFDIEGKYRNSHQDSIFKSDVDKNFSFAGEVFITAGENVKIGVGAEYQIPRTGYLYPGHFNFVPLYLVMRSTPLMDASAPYLTGRIGYGILSNSRAYNDYFAGQISDTRGGFHYGVGAGVETRRRTANIFGEILYLVYNGGAKVSSDNYDIRYSKWSIIFGISF
jgi:hypothetical protein